MIISELLTKLGFVSDVSGLESFMGKLSAAKIKILAVAAAIEETARRVTEFFSKSLEGIDQEGRFAEQVGLTVVQLQKLQYAAQQAGGTSEDLDQSIRALNKSIFEASEGAGGAVEIFGRLGIATVTNAGKLRPTVQVFAELADKLKNLPTAEQQDFAARVGISNSTLLLLQRGSRGIRALTDEAEKLGLYTEEDAKKAEEYAQSIRRVNQVLTVLKNQIAVSLAPLLTDIVNSISEWVSENREFLKVVISTAVKSLVVVLTGLVYILGIALTLLSSFFSLIKKLIEGVKALVQWLGGFKNVMETLAFAAGFAAIFKLIPNIWKLINLFKMLREAILAFGLGFRILILVPVLISGITKAFKAARIAVMAFNYSALLIPALIASLALIAQDIYVFFKGGDSVTGRLLEKLPRLKAFLQGFGSGVWAVIKLLLQGFDELLGLIVSLGRSISDFSKAIAGIVGGVFKNLFSGIKDAYNDMIDFFVDKFKAVEGFFSRFGSALKVNGTSSNMLGRSALISTLPLTTSQTTNNSNVQSASSNATHNTFNISVASGPGNKDVADAVRKGIYDASRQANRNNYSPAVL